jgi:hypothetical protein
LFSRMLESWRAWWPKRMSLHCLRVTFRMLLLWRRDLNHDTIELCWVDDVFYLPWIPPQINLWLQEAYVAGESLQEMLIGIFIGVYSLMWYSYSYDIGGKTEGRVRGRICHNDTVTSISGLMLLR